MLCAPGKPMLLSFFTNDDCCLVLDVDGKHWLLATFGVKIQHCVGFLMMVQVGVGWERELWLEPLFTWKTI